MKPLPPNFANNHLIELVRRSGMPADVELIERFASLAPQLHPDDPLYQCLSLLGIFSQFYDKLPTELRKVLDKNLLDNKEVFAGYLRALSVKMDSLPIDTKRELIEFLRSTECREMLQSAVQPVLTKSSELLKITKALSGERGQAHQAACEQCRCNLAGNAVIVHRMVYWNVIFLVLLLTSLGVGALLSWQWYSQLGQTSVRSIERGFASMGVDAHVERPPDGLFVDLTLGRNLRDYQIYVDHRVPDLLKLRFLQTNAYPPQEAK